MRKYQDLPITIRELEPGDKGLILLSWVDAVMDICPKIRIPELFWLDKRYFRARYWELVSKVLENRPDLFLCAIHPDHPDQIFGWTCQDKDVIHMCYVKGVFRRYGIAGLLTGGIRTVSHWTTYCEKIAKRHRLQYNPKCWEDLIHDINRSQKDSTTFDRDRLEASAINPEHRDAQRTTEIPDGMETR
jgi:hypothetical protein